VPEVVDRRCGDARLRSVADRREASMEKVEEEVGAELGVQRRGLGSWGWWMCRLGHHYIRALGGPSFYDSFECNDGRWPSVYLKCSQCVHSLFCQCPLGLGTGKLVFDHAHFLNRRDLRPTGGAFG
jgi:hypothetical protein